MQYDFLLQLQQKQQQQQAIKHALKSNMHNETVRCESGFSPLTVVFSRQFYGV